MARAYLQNQRPAVWSLTRPVITKQAMTIRANRLASHGQKRDNHTKIYREEKERPCFILADLSSSNAVWHAINV